MNDGISYVIVACSPDKGMKSLGSKGLLSFNKKKLFEYQFEWIKNKNKNKLFEIIIVCDFDNQKIKKAFDNSNIFIHECCNTNPIYAGCSIAKYPNIVFIDYGCLFDSSIISCFNDSSSCILCTNKSSQLPVGCQVNNNIVSYLFFGLENNYFCNIFYINSKDKVKILNNPVYKRFNLLYFEILNMLIDSGSQIGQRPVKPSDFMFFTKMSQKNAINKFINKISN